MDDKRVQVNHACYKINDLTYRVNRRISRFIVDRLLKVSTFQKKSTFKISRIESLLQDTSSTPNILGKVLFIKILDSYTFDRFCHSPSITISIYN